MGFNLVFKGLKLSRETWVVYCMNHVNTHVHTHTHTHTHYIKILYSYIKTEVGLRRNNQQDATL